jgi:uroporphyrinogen decarboxylase
MNKRQRLECAIRGGKPDKVPVSIYQHSAAHDRGVDEFVAYTLDFHSKFDPDYVKVMYDELYDTPVNYQFAVDASVWEQLQPLDPHKAAFGRYLESLKRIRDAVPEDTPVIATIYSPFHIGVRLAWKRILEDMCTSPEKVNKGLEIITENLVSLVAAARKESGIDGFFLGAFGAETEWLSLSEYERIESPLDRAVLDAMKGMPFIIVHAHGEKGSYFDLFSTYPCNALSWEDRLAGPDIEKARKRTSKCLVGGVDHVAAQSCLADQVYEQARDAIAKSKGAGFILAPGCTFLGRTPTENMLALRRAAEDMVGKV